MNFGLICDSENHISMFEDLETVVTNTVYTKTVFFLTIIIPNKPDVYFFLFIMMELSQAPASLPDVHMNYFLC